MDRSDRLSVNNDEVKLWCAIKWRGKVDHTSVTPNDTLLLTDVEFKKDFENMYNPPDVHNFFFQNNDYILVSDSDITVQDISG